MKRRIMLVLVCFAILLSAVSALTLQESIDYGVKNNPGVVAARNKVNAASARLGQAVGTFLPTVKLDGNYNRTYTEPSTVQITTQTTSGAVTQNFIFGTNDPGTVKSYTASLNQPLFVGALFPGYQIAKKGVDLAQTELLRTTQETAYNVTVAYFGVLSADKYVKLSEESLQMAKSHLNQVSAMLENGATTKADFLRSEVQVANAEVGLTNANNTFQLAKNSFNNVLGRGVDEPVTISEEPLAAPTALPDDQQLFQVALANSPSWRQFVLGKKMAEDNLTVARSALLPTAFLTGSTGNRLTEYPSYTTSANSWAVTGAASWTLFDGLGIQNRIREASANLDVQNATEEQVKNNLALDVRNALFNLKSALENLRSTKKAVDSAEENYLVSTQRYGAGVATNIEVLDAQVSLTQARINYLKASFDIETGKAKINQIVGKEVI